MPKRRVKDEDDFVVDDDLDLEVFESDEFIDEEDAELEEDAKPIKSASKAKAPAKRGAKRSAAEG
jgi:hypothetical protein